MELKLFFLFWITKREKSYVLWMQGLIICLWESLSFIEAEASFFWWDMTSLVALEVVISTTFGVPGAVGFRRRFYSCVLRFGDNSVDSRYVAVIQRYGSDEHNNYYGKNLVRLTPMNDDPYFVLTGEIWDFHDWKFIAIYRGWNG